MCVAPAATAMLHQVEVTQVTLAQFKFLKSHSTLKSGCQLSISCLLIPRIEILSMMHGFQDSITDMFSTRCLFKIPTADGRACAENLFCL